MNNNPLLLPYNTKYQLPPFNEIKPEHYLPAIEYAINIHNDEIKELLNIPIESYVWSTIEKYESTGRTLENILLVFNNITASHTNDQLQELDLLISPKIAMHYKAISLNTDLFKRLQFVKQNSVLNSEETRLLDKLILDMIRDGVLLTENEKIRMSEICERQALLHTKFSQNVLYHEAEYKLILDKSDLIGLPSSIAESAALKATECGHDGKYVFTISRSSVEPFLTYSSRSDLRKIIYDAWVSRGAGKYGEKYDNRPIIAEIVELRMEEAKLLGYDTYAKFKLDNTMAGTPEAVLKLLNQVWEASKKKAEVEKKMLEEEAVNTKAGLPVDASDWRYFSEKARLARFNVDPDILKPYFVLENMMQAAFYTANRLFNVTFTETREHIQVYHPDVKVYEVRNDNAERDLIGIFISDNFARSSKRSGAWMSNYRLQEKGVLPIIVNNNNFNKGEPYTLLDFDDIRTLFHEFGHGLHGLLSNCKYRTISGTSVLKDFVEFPSQMMEHWAASSEVLMKFAKHAVTGEIIPEELLSAFLRAKNFDQGFGTSEYIGSALFDMTLHSLPNDENTRTLLKDPVEFEKSVMDRIKMPVEIGSRHRAVHFQHLFSDSSYAAGYYVYLWANVLDCDGFEAFKEVNDVFDSNLAVRLKKVYQSGNLKHPMDLFREFRGRGPEVDALLRDRELL